MKKYNNIKATIAIAKASFRSIIRSPSAVVFSLAFPLIFIVVFANIGGGAVTVDVALAKTCDTSSANTLYQSLKQIPIIHFVKNQSADEMAKNLSKGDLDAIIDIQKHDTAPYYTLNIKYTTASAQKDGVLKSLLDGMFFRINSKGNTVQQPIAELKEATVHGRQYKYIDFLLPGMLGFSLLSSGVFGTAFVFLSLRLTLVIKRFFATPVKKYSIVLGEAIARLIFSWIGALFIILVGHYFFGFTLIHGVVTVINMLILSALGLIVFMGFGFIISGIAKNESSVPPLSNIITMPQFLLSGTFFAITVFPKWLQGISNILPLTYLNKAMRDVAFEGAGLGDVTHDLLILGVWFIIVYAVAVKTFKWE
ncbi:ABC transporter permease [Mucilaginibacter sp.]|uniref:ABC transporter permease n=1 Tax=Mucilaginibacter sp. TaxID=1882438 RepID=UPI00283E991B|nr:ABC transporter permease [Mucilaginibacter sp.]MDR3694373.1 ABC transporter permease [Mucilaginibacter sp.]